MLQMTDRQQMTFGLDPLPSHLESDYIDAACNRPARSALERVGEWPQGRCVLTGPAGSGKTHLARIWSDHNLAGVCRGRDSGGLQRTGAKPLVIEDVHEAAGRRRLETALFDVVNRSAADGRLLLLTGRGRPAGWGLVLPDLASRLIGSCMAEIGPPGDDLVAGLILKQFSDRQVTLNAATVRYLARRCPRSYDAIHAAVAALDAMSLAGRKQIGRTQIDAYFSGLGAGGLMAES